MPTWTGNGADNNWSTAGNWDTGAVPTLSTSALFTGAGANGNKNVIITSGAICSNLDFTGYSGTANFANTLTIRGSGVNLGTTVVLTGSAALTLTINSTDATMTSNGVVWGRPIIVNVNGSSGFTTTFTDNWTITSFTSNAVGGNPVFMAASGGAIVTLTGNLSISQPITAPSLTFRLTGIGTVGSFPFSSSSGNFNANIQIDSGANTTSLGNLILSGGSLSWISGVVSASGTLTIFSGSVTLNLQNQQLNNYIQNGSCIVTLLSDANFNNVTLGTGGYTTITLNGVGFKLKCRGNFTHGNTSANILGSGIISLIGSGNINAVVAQSANVDFEINTSGTYVFTSNYSFGGIGKSFTHTSGTVVAGVFTVTFSQGYTLNISNINWYNVIFSGGSNAYVINSPLSITNNLTVSSITTIFAGDEGFTTNNLIVSLAGSTITYQAGVTYKVNGSLVAIGTAASRITFQSSNRATFVGAASGTVLTYTSGTIPSIGMTLSHTNGALPAGLNNLLPIRPIIASGSSPNFTLSNSVTPATNSISLTAGNKAFFVLGTSASQQLGYITTHDIDSSSGQTIYAFDSIIDTNLFRTLNWERLLAPVSSGIGFINFS
jgi:hypothetical protein